MRVKTEERRQAILEIAKELFIDKGFDQTSMTEISQKLGGSKATLYNYFDSKESIFAAVMEMSATRDIVAAFSSLSNSVSLKETLVSFGCHYLQYILTPEVMSIHKMAYNEAERSEIGLYFWQHGPQRGWSHVSEFFQERMEEGALRRSDPWVATFQLKALLEAELLDKFMLGVIGQPHARQIKEVVCRAVDSFLCIHKV